MKAPVLAKADASDAGEGGSDSQIIAAPAARASMVSWGRKQRGEEGREAGVRRERRLPSRGFSPPRRKPSCLGLFRASQDPRTLDIAAFFFKSPAPYAGAHSRAADGRFRRPNWRGIAAGVLGRRGDCPASPLFRQARGLEGAIPAPGQFGATAGRCAPAAPPPPV
jgi:hypothetical protein